MKSTNRFTVIKVINWHKFQNVKGDSNQNINQNANHQITNKQPTNNHQITNTLINNNVNNVNNVENVKNSNTFIKPTLEELEKYIIEKGYHFDAETFIAFYESNGWKVGKNPMKSWKGACVTWEKNRTTTNNRSTQKESVLDRMLREEMAKHEQTRSNKSNENDIYDVPYTEYQK